MTEDDYIMMSAAAAVSIIINRRRRRHLQHNRQCWSREWLQRRNTERGVANFVDQELSEDFVGFHGFLRMTSDVFNEILYLTVHGRHLEIIGILLWYF